MVKVGSVNNSNICLQKVESTVVNLIRDFHSITFLPSLLKGWSGFCKLYLIWKTLNERYKVCSSCLCGTLKLALPSGRGWDWMASWDVFTPGLFWDLLLLHVLRMQLCDFLSELYVLVPPAGFVVEPMPGCPVPCGVTWHWAAGLLD